MLSRKAVIKTMREIPDEFSVDDAVERLIVLHKIQLGSQEIAEGKGLSTQQAKKKLQKWLK
jgi:hypothetical protein